MWTTENRSRYDRSRLRYRSDVTDAEWALIAAMIPPAKRGGNARTVDLREVVNALVYIRGGSVSRYSVSVPITGSSAG